jgi:glycosyltransferase involved in cell wall biosynthesis
MLEIFLFTKNEIDFIEIFVKKNLPIADKMTIIDNGSTDGTWQKILELASQTDKIQSIRHTEPFQHKARILTEYMRSSKAQVIIPLDTDEILAYEDDDGTVFTEIGLIRNHLIDLSKLLEGKLKVKHIYNFIPNSNNYFAIDKHNKFIFLHSDFDSIDTGFHRGQTIKKNSPVHKTNLVYLHFHFRSFDAWLKSTQQKLEARLGDGWNDIEVLSQYKKPRPSHHIALEYSNYLQTGKWHNLKPIKRINHNIWQ